MRSQPLKLVQDRDLIRQLNTNACQQGLGRCGVVRSQQFCVCRLQQQTEGEACHDALGTGKLVRPNGSVFFSS